MSVKVFLDTNIFIYMRSSEADKKEISCRALNSFECVVSTQVLNEFCSVALKKLALDTSLIRQVIHAINNTCEIAVVTLETVEKALWIQERYELAYYDSLIVASALENDCTYLLTEDMGDGQIIESKMEIVNIFARPGFI